MRLAMMTFMKVGVAGGLGGLALFERAGLGINDSETFLTSKTIGRLAGLRQHKGRSQTHSPQATASVHVSAARRISRVSMGKSGRGRSYVKLDGKLDYADWCEGIHRGRNYVGDGRSHLLDFTVNDVRSSWLAVRILPSSHTNPIWVLVAGKPVRASRRSAEWCRKGVDQCWSQKERFIKRDELEQAKADDEHARRTYQRLINESEVE